MKKGMFTCLVVIMAVALGMMPDIQLRAANSRKTSLSSKNLTIKKGKTKTLKVKNTKKKTKWKVATGKNKISLKKKTKKAVQITGKQTGSAKVQATVGSKKLICKVKVINESKGSKDSKDSGKIEEPVISTPDKKTGFTQQDQTKENEDTAAVTSTPEPQATPGTEVFQPIEYAVNDVENLKTLIGEQRSLGASVSEEIENSEEYIWDEGKLVGIRWNEKGLSGTLDLQGFLSLQEVECRNNKLEEIKINKTSDLTYLDCDKNKLQTLDLSEMYQLKYLICSNNEITNLNVSKCPELTVLYCNGNMIETLNITEDMLEYVWCFGNHLTELNVDNSSIIELRCSDNQIQKLSVNNCPDLEVLDCKNNSLDSLNVSECASLEQLECDNTVSVKGYTADENNTYKEIALTYKGHVQNYGWQSEVGEGITCGTTGKSKRLEAIMINLKDNQEVSGIKYRTHVQNYGWQEWKTSGELSGTTGKSKAIEAIEISLENGFEEKYDLYYRVHVENVGWLDWAKNGETAGSTGLSVDVQAVQIKLMSKGDSFDTGKNAALKRPTFVGQGHSAYSGWLSAVGENKTIGTTGKSKRLEAIKLSLNDGNISGNLEYRAHISNVGWQAWKKSGEIAGTTGEGKPIEAVQIRLTGCLDAVFDIYYRVHSANIGWLGWAKNGAYAGTTGGGVRAEAIQVVLVNKGTAFSVGGTAYKKLSKTTTIPIESNTGILKNGLAGININIYGVPYTTFKTYSYGQNAYTTEGCAWFASARVNQLTGKGNIIRAGSNWWRNATSLGFSRGNSIRARSIVCWGGHVAIVEKIVGNTAYMSEGGNRYYSDAAHGYTRIWQEDVSNVATLNRDFLGYVYF